MKLSKAQQKVVDKMQEGHILIKSIWTGNTWLRKDQERIYIKSNTLRALLISSRIERYDLKAGTEYYRLTEQYKNEQK